jgi:hypothetical protein
MTSPAARSAGIFRGHECHALRPAAVMSLLPEDPLVRWVIWLLVAVSVGAPLLAGLILLIVR